MCREKVNRCCTSWCASQLLSIEEVKHSVSFNNLCVCVSVCAFVFMYVCMYVGFHAFVVAEKWFEFVCIEGCKFSGLVCCILKIIMHD